MSETTRSVLVTGASRGIGRAIALRLARDGYDVVVHCRSRAEEAVALAAEIREIGRSARVLCFDIGEREACARLLSADVEAHGAYYGVVCNAGIARDAAFPAMTGEEWDGVVRTNLDGFYNVLHPLVMPMVRRRKPGRIITIASVSGMVGNRGQTNYSAAKAGIIGATKALALELAKREITVNCIAPGLIATDMLSDEIVEEALKLVPMRRVGRPDEVAALCSFLMSDQAGYITRQVISVNGGNGLMRRVVITGVGAISPLGNDWPTVLAQLQRRQNCVRRFDEWSQYVGLNTRLGAPAAEFALPEHYNRKRTRSMGRVALMATRASELALIDAGLLDDPILRGGRVGIAYGSSAGSPAPMSDVGRMMLEKNTQTINATTYIKMMSHTAPVNIGVFFGITGRVIPTSSACTSGSQGIGSAYEAIKAGYQDVMLAGGADELDVTAAAVFDTLFATSTRNDTPALTPRPFDAQRDGLVVGEGAGTLILESHEHACARGARIHTEIVGYGTNCDGQHVTQPSADTMAVAMQLALRDAGLAPAAIDYVNAHGTATDHGDIAETLATQRVFGERMPISSLKSYTGHTLGACGALEAWVSFEMMRAGWFAPTINLDQVDPRCAALDYLTGDGRRIDAEYVMSNNFAFGGINTSLIIRRWTQ